MYDDENPNIVDTDKPKANNNPKPDKTVRKKLENYLDDLELRRQLNDWDDRVEDK